jgi:hypothetical protein
MSARRPAVKWLATAGFLIGTLAPITAVELRSVTGGEPRDAGPFREEPSLDQRGRNDGAASGALDRLPSSQRILAPERATSPGQNRPKADRHRTSEAANADPDASDPALRRAHVAALAARPFLQRLPYRDREVGVALDSVTPQGTPVLLVTFLGTLRAARLDIGAVLARSHDPGSEYELRFERLIR